MNHELIALKPEIVAKARVTEAQRVAMYDAAAKDPDAYWRDEAKRIWQESLKISPENDTLKKTLQRFQP